MIIKNFKSLALTRERENALKIINSGIEAVLVKPMMREQIKISNNLLRIQNHSWNLSNYKKIEWRGKGTYCEQCGMGFEIKNDSRRKFVDKNGNISYICNPNGDCNYN